MANQNGAVAELLKNSVTEGDAFVSAHSGGLAYYVLPIMSGYSGNIGALPPDPPRYWCLERDMLLRATVLHENLWASAINIAQTKTASLSFDVEGEKPLNVKRAQEMMLTLDGEGWVKAQSKGVRDYLTCDNGEWWEIVRASSAVGSRILGLVHLDSLRCLGRDSRVLMADGTTKSILDLVRGQSTESVMALDVAGRLVPKKITGWHETPLDGRHWLRLKLRHGSWSWGKKQGLWLTNDHEVLTSGGWKRADELQLGSKVATRHKDVSCEQAQLLAGALLGDASLSAWSKDKSMGASLALGQGQAQEEWIDIKIGAFGQFEWSNKRYSKRQLSPRLVIQAQTKYSPVLAAWRDVWYPNGKKIVPRGLVEENFSPRMLAAWYMDDGDLFAAGGRPNPGARLATHGFEKEDTEWLAELLTSKGYDTRVHKGAEYKGRQYYTLYITSAGARKLFFHIGAFVPPSMRYKLPDFAPEYEPDEWKITAHNIYYDSVESIETGSNGDQATAFCIDVEDEHNFVAGDMVVHNCLRTGDDERPAMYMDLRGRYHELRDYQVINLTDMPSPAAEFLGVGLCAASRAYSHIYKMANIERYVNEKISGSRPQEIHFINGVMPKQLDAALRGADEAQAQRGAVNFKGALVVPMPAGTTVTGYVVPLSELPDGFDRKQEFDLAVTIYADAIGLDPQDLQPLSGQGLGTGTQSRVLAEKSKGKGLAARQKQWTHEMNEKVFSEGVTFIFQERDLDDELKQAEVEGARAGTRSQMISSGEITAIEARQLAVDSDDLPKEFTPPTGDVTPDDILSDEEKPMVGELDPIPLPDLPAPKVTLPPITSKSVNEVLRDFRDTLTRWVVDAANGNKTAGDMSRAMRSALRRLAPQAYTEGMREGGVADPESELDEADETQIDNWLGQQGEFVLEFSRDAAKVSDLTGDEKTAARRAILDRAALWEASLRTLGSLGYASAKANMSVTWEYSDTEHCPTCRRLNGVTHRLKWFTQKNYLPQSPGAAMDCGGFNCKCILRDKNGKTVMP